MHQKFKTGDKVKTKSGELGFVEGYDSTGAVVVCFKPGSSDKDDYWCFREDTLEYAQ